jgi:hypothetical protein
VSELAEAQRAVAVLLSDPEEHLAWQADPAGYARDRLGHYPRAAAMVGGLDLLGVWTAATFAIGKLGDPPPPVDRSAPDPGMDVGSQRGARPWDATGRPLVGTGYRRALIPHLWRHLDQIEVFEHTVDNYLHGWPAGREELARFADQGPLVLHSIQLSVGSDRCREDPDRVDAIAELCRAARVDNLSDHLSWTRVDAVDIGDFVPLWRTEEQLDLVCSNVDWLQDRLGVRMAFENASVHFDPGGDLGWAEFANEVVRRTGCGLLLDLTNLLINEANGLMSAASFLDELDLGAVLAVHLAGGHVVEGTHVDSHQHPVGVSDLELLTRVLPDLTGCRSVIVERDDRFEAGAEVVDDLSGIHAAVREASLVAGGLSDRLVGAP